MAGLRIIAFGLIIMVFVDLAAGIKWLVWDCSLVGYQVRFCRRMADIMPVIMRAGRGTAYVCMAQFAGRRWNCSSVLDAPRLRPDLTKGTREQAYVYALAAAAVMHQVAKACVTGHIPYCPCGPTPNEIEIGFKWKGCSDNVLYGRKASIEWADAPWRARLLRRNRKNRQRNRNRLAADGRTLVSMSEFMRGADRSLTPKARMNQHNNHVGREVTARSLRTKCKCHGVSSSCSLKTCWKVLPSLAEIGHELQQSYTRATEVRAMPSDRPPSPLSDSAPSPYSSVDDMQLQSIGTNPSGVGNRLVMRPGDGHLTYEQLLQIQRHAADRHERTSNPHPLPAPPTNAEWQPVALRGSVGDTDLVYIAKSPDYCTRDPRVGSDGTHGRECNTTAKGHSNCEIMCCGRGYRTRQFETEYNCQCRYVHCCYVQCEKCTKMELKHFCN